MCEEGRVGEDFKARPGRSAFSWLEVGSSGGGGGRSRLLDQSIAVQLPEPDKFVSSSQQQHKGAATTTTPARDWRDRGGRIGVTGV